LTHIEAVIKKKRTHKPKAKQAKAEDQETNTGPTVSAGSDGVNVDQTKCQEDQSATQTDKYFGDLWNGLKRHLRDPKFFVEILALVGLAMYVCETRRTNNLSQQALGNAKSQLRLTVRPWIGIADEPDAVKTSPIRFDEKGNASIGYAIKVKNFSNIAAQNVMSNAELVITDYYPITDSKQKEACGDGYVGNPDIGNVIFPGKDGFSQQSASTFARSDMVAKSYTKKLQAFLVGCVGYRDQFKTVVYHTGFVYRLVDPRTNETLQFDPIPNTVLNGVFLPSEAGSFVD
jgi:hypothetical protein